MEENRNSVELVRSDFSLSDAEESEDKIDLFFSNYPTWSTRYRCILAYICLFMSFATTLDFCKSLAKYGSILFCLIGTTAVSIAYGNMCSLYLLRYFFACFAIYPTWMTCDESWAKINCYQLGEKEKAIFKCLRTHSESFCRNLTWESSGTQYWKYYVGNTESVLNVILSIACLFLSVCFIIIINYKGIRSIEKMFVILVYCAMMLELFLIFKSFTLSEALFGIKKLFSCDWNVFLSKQIWIDALENTFIFLNLGKLSLSFISSHGKFTDDIIIDIIIIICGSFLFYILMTFPILCLMINNKYKMYDTEPGQLAFKDSENVFISMSEAVLLYGTFGAGISYLNWFLLSTSSQAVLILAFCEALMGMSRRLAKFRHFIVTFSFLSFILNIIFIFLKFDFNWNFDTVIVTTVLLFTITWQLFYGIKKFNNDFYFMMGYPLPIFLKCTWFTLLTLPLIGLILKMYYKIPDTPLKNIVYIYAGVPFLIYILVFLIQIILSFKKKILRVFKADPNWGPDNSLLQRSRIVFETETLTTEFMYRQELYRKPLMKPPTFADQNIVQLI